jgi:hypothetical protein
MGLILRKGTPFIICLILAINAGCWQCSVERDFNSPAKPLKTHGWKQFQHGSIVVDGEFVVEVGKSVDNGKVGVRVVTLSPARCRPFREPEFPSATLEFFNVAGGEVICRSPFRPGSVALRSYEMCGESFEWSAIGISAVNANERWVAFELVK